jgi:chaperonin cofactor prefoldin
MSDDSPELRLAKVEKSEIDSVKEGKAIYIRKGNLLFQASKKAALSSVRDRLTAGKK